MKVHSERFKEQITKMGRQQNVTVTYTVDGQDHTLDFVLNDGNNRKLYNSVINSITPYYNGNLLKSVMKGLDIDSNVKIPKGSEINFKYGLFIDDDTSYEYLDYGKYIVYDVEEQKDTNSYLIKCYDKLIYSMVNYEKLNINYPITIREYINAICEYLNLKFKNKNETFANYNKEILSELYDGLGYTFRDVLDELATVTGSSICINDNDELEIRYINETNDTINEEFLKDINVNFGNKYGPINSIVLSRAEESDNVFLQDEESIKQNGLCELKIRDNQILNSNDRSDFLPDLLESLKGVEYYINDYTSTGIMYYDLLDRYTVSIKGNLYSCVMLNDEQNITQGLEELIYTEEPGPSETDYTKADKTDKKINQTYIMVDKQNQKIEELISQQTEQSSKLVQVEKTVDGITQKVEDVEDLTNTVTGIKEIELNNCVAGDLLELHIYGNNTVFDYLYPSNDLSPSNTLYPYGDSRIVVTNFPENSEEGTAILYELGITEVLRQNEETQDEYILKDGKAQIIRRVNADGTTKLNEVIEDLGEYKIPLLSGDNVITIKNYTTNLKAKFAVKNTYTDRFATKVEMSSSITQTAEKINLEVSKKVGENEVISKINQSAEQVQIEANKISLKRKRNQFDR